MAVQCELCGKIINNISPEDLDDDDLILCDECETDRYEYEREERTCPDCGGTGGDKWNDGVIPCPTCDGEGYLWWL